MEETQDKSKNSSVIKHIIYNPFFGIGVGILVTIIFYFLSIKEAKPVYSVISDEIISKQGSNSKINIYYDSVKVENVRLAKIAFWNNGNTFLGKDDIIGDGFISIQPDKSARILEANILKTSRLNLLFEKKIISNSIKLKILGNEGLEKNDGGTLQIFYTSKDTLKWNIVARIKGISPAFEEVSKNNAWNFLIEFVPSILIPPLSLILLEFCLNLYKKKKYSILILIVALILITFAFLFYRYRNEITFSKFSFSKITFSKIPEILK